MKIPRVIFALCALVIALFEVSATRGQTSADAAKAVSSPQLVIIDTDIGDDIDDAFALALALQSPELKILGVTTTFGNTEMRARLLDRYLKAVGRSDIPVFAGPMTGLMIAGTAYFWHEILAFFAGLSRKIGDEADTLEKGEQLRRVA